MPLHSILWVLKETYLFMALELCMHFVSRANCVISSSPFRYLENTLPFHGSTYTILIPHNKALLYMHPSLLDVDIVLSLQIILRQNNPYLEMFFNSDQCSIMTTSCTYRRFRIGL